jgi:hypothetical protein
MKSFLVAPKLVMRTKKSRNPNQITGKILLLKMVERDEIFVTVTLRAV